MSKLLTQDINIKYLLYTMKPSFPLKIKTTLRTEKHIFRG